MDGTAFVEDKDAVVSLRDKGTQTGREKTLEAPISVNLESISVKIVAGAYAFHIDRETVEQNASGYLLSAVKKDWQLGPITTVTLNDVEHLAVKAYIRWLNRGKVFWDNFSFDRAVATHQELAEAYILADQLSDDKYGNAVIDAVVRTVINSRPGYFPQPEVIDMVFDNVPKGGQLGRLYIKLYATFGKPDWANDSMHPQFLLGLSQELQTQLAFATRKRGQYQKDIVQNRCQYHRHHKEEAVPGSEVSKIHWGENQGRCSELKVKQWWWKVEKVVQEHVQPMPAAKSKKRSRKQANDNVKYISIDLP